MDAGKLTQRHRGTEAESALVTGAIIGAAIEVHRALGPGLLESAYEAALCHELTLRGLSFERQVPVPLVYKNTSLPLAFTADLIVANMVVIELKAIEQTAAVHKRQLLTYLRLTGCRYGLLLNFGAERMIDGITRVVDGYA
jgi:GxxExxY protein